MQHYSKIAVKQHVSIFLYWTDESWEQGLSGGILSHQQLRHLYTSEHIRLETVSRTQFFCTDF